MRTRWGNIENSTDLLVRARASLLRFSEVELSLGLHSWLPRHVLRKVSGSVLWYFVSQESRDALCNDGLPRKGHKKPTEIERIPRP